MSKRVKINTVVGIILILVVFFCGGCLYYFVDGYSIDYVLKKLAIQAIVLIIGSLIAGIVGLAINLVIKLMVSK